MDLSTGTSAFSKSVNDAPYSAAEIAKSPELHYDAVKTENPDTTVEIKAGSIRSIIKSSIADTLGDANYSLVNANQWAKEITEKVGIQVKELQMKRYKHIVQVQIGQHTGCGSKYITRCRWDISNDTLISESFSNDHLFCVVVVFLVIMY